jgi:hypothetical protein
LESKGETVFFHDLALAAESGIKENVKSALKIFTNKY